MTKKERKELKERIESLEEAIFLEQMKDYIDWPWYYEARSRLNILKEELKLSEKEKEISKGSLGTN